MRRLSRDDRAVLEAAGAEIDAAHIRGSHGAKVRAANQWIDSLRDLKMPRFDRRFVPWYLRRLIPKSRRGTPASPSNVRYRTEQLELVPSVLCAVPHIAPGAGR